MTHLGSPFVYPAIATACAHRGSGASRIGSRAWPRHRPYRVLLLSRQRSRPLGELAERFRGMRPPRFPSIFEALLNGVACQQISLQAGLTLLNRLVVAFGEAPNPPEEGRPAFPRPQALAGIGSRSLQALGFSRAKSLAISEIAAAVAAREIEYESSRKSRRCSSLRKIGGAARSWPLDGRICSLARLWAPQCLSWG